MTRWARDVRTAFVTMTCTIASYTKVHCPRCDRWVMSAPGLVSLSIRRPRDNADRSGAGWVAPCDRCKGLVEAVIVGTT